MSAVPSWLLDGVGEKIGLILVKRRTGRKTSSLLSVSEQMDTSLLQCCPIRNQPHFAFHLLDVCLDKTCKQAITDAKAHGALDTQGEKIEENVLQKLGALNEKDDKSQ